MYEKDWLEWSHSWNRKLASFRKKYFQNSSYIDKGYYNEGWSNLRISAGYLYTIWSDLHCALTTQTKADLNSEIVQYYKEGINAAYTEANEY